ncbi:MAG: preprotein translocase subunit YajC [Treponema sp.]|nr:preprotein translocase subunit YajC [Treponema sp.]
MDTFTLHLLMGVPQGDPNAAVSGGSLIGSFLPFIAIIAIFYFLIIRPQSKKRKETEKMLSSLKKGDRIVTIGGLYGTIQSVKDTTVIVRVDDNIKLEFLRSAISSVTIPASEPKDEKSDDKKKIEDKKEEKEKSEEKTSEDGE